MQILIYGSREFAQTVAELVADGGYEVACFIDDFSPAPHIVGSLEQARRIHPPSEYTIAIAVGYNQLAARWKGWKRVRTACYRAPALIHPRAYVAKSATVGDGAMLMAGSLVDVSTTVGGIVVAWPGTCISHDCVVGENSFISPIATLCGYVNLGVHHDVPSWTRIKMHSSYLKAFA